MRSITPSLAALFVLVAHAIAVGQNPAVRQAAADEGEQVSRRTEVFPNDPSIPSTVSVLQDIVYGSPGGRELRLDVVINAFFGGSPEEIPKRYDEASPIQRLTEDTPPMLFLHGDQDRCVSHEQALAMVRRLTELNVPAEVEVYEGKPHAWFNKDPDWRITIERVEPFLKKHFKLK